MFIRVVNLLTFKGRDPGYAGVGNHRRNPDPASARGPPGVYGRDEILMKGAADKLRVVIADDATAVCLDWYPLNH